MLPHMLNGRVNEGSVRFVDDDIVAFDDRTPLWNWIFPEVVLSCAIGFGGHNTAVIFARYRQ